MFYYNFAVCIVANLVFWDVIPVHDKVTREGDLMFCLQICNLINCNSFLSTMYGWTPVILGSYFSQLMATKDLWVDPYTGLPIS